MAQNTDDNSPDAVRAHLNDIRDSIQDSFDAVLAGLEDVRDALLEVNVQLALAYGQPVPVDAKTNAKTEIAALQRNADALKAAVANVDGDIVRRRKQAL